MMVRNVRIRVMHVHPDVHPNLAAHLVVNRAGILCFAKFEMPGDSVLRTFVFWARLLVCEWKPRRLVTRVLGLLYCAIHGLKPKTKHSTSLEARWLLLTCQLGRW